MEVMGKDGKVTRITRRGKNHTVEEGRAINMSVNRGGNSWARPTGLFVGHTHGDPGHGRVTTSDARGISGSLLSSNPREA